MPFTEERWLTNTAKKIKTRLITGLVVMIPAVITFFVLRFVFVFVDGLFQPVYEGIFKKNIPGIGFITVIIFLYIAGTLTTYVIGKKFLKFFEDLFIRIPMVKSIYNTSKKLINNLSLPGNQAFKKVVLVEYPRPGLKALGFVTGECKDYQNKKMLLVYFPTAVNPTSGMMEIVSPEEAVDTNMTIEEGLSMILSAGVIHPEIISVGAKNEI